MGPTRWWRWCWLVLAAPGLVLAGVPTAATAPALALAPAPVPGGGHGLTQAQTQPATAPAVDAALPTYQPQNVLHGRMRTAGSDTMDRLMKLWEQEFRKTHRYVQFFHEGKGSATAVPCLTKGLTEFGPMSREINSFEARAFQEKFGYAPVQIRVALDALAVYVNAENPVARRGLSLAELDGIFSQSHKRPPGTDIKLWGQLGLTGIWGAAPMDVFSRNEASGTYAFFKEHVLEGGDFRESNKKLVGSAAVIAAVAADRNGIGFSGIGYKTDQVAAVPLIAVAGQPPVPPDEQFTYDRRYPLARFLYLAMNHRPGAELTPLQREFVQFVLSRQGQEAVVAEGFFPLTAVIAGQERGKLGLP